MKNINLKIHKGELVFLIGPSGSGKTTLAKIISGLEDQTTGKIIICGKKFQKLTEMEKANFRLEIFGMVSQQGNLHPYLIIEENILLKDIISGIKTSARADNNQQNSKLLEEYNIAHRKDSHPLEISGGELQRATLAIANYKSPEILILDEPTANMDSDLAEKVMKLIYDTHQKKTNTIIIATHDITLLRKGSRVIYLTDGRISRDGLVI